MQQRLLSVLASTLLGLSIGALARPAHALDFTVLDPIVRQNLAVYPIRGGSGNGPTPSTLQQAVSNGVARVYEVDGEHVVENQSNQSVFVQMGSLLIGGSQDQVAATDLILPPRSGRVTLPTFCVDPFRAAGRTGESAKTYTTANMLFPWNAAKLSMFAGESQSKAALRLRRAGVWWSIDTLRTELAEVTGGPLEPVKSVSWPHDEEDTIEARAQLAARHGGWTTSLPLALTSPRLQRAQLASAGAFAGIEKRMRGVIGVAFVINGRLAGAELYQSSALFRQMWPIVFRTYITEALATRSSGREVPPAAEAVEAAIREAAHGEERAASDDGTIKVRDSASAIYVEGLTTSAAWVHRTIIPKPLAGATTRSPESALAQILESGEVNGHRVEGLTAEELVIPTHSGIGDAWAATITRPGNSVAQTSSDATIAYQHIVGSVPPLRQTLPVVVPVVLLMWMVLLMLVMRGSVARVARKGAVTLTLTMRGLIGHVQTVNSRAGELISGVGEFVSRWRRRIKAIDLSVGKPVPQASPPANEIARGILVHLQLPAPANPTAPHSIEGQYRSAA